MTIGTFFSYSFEKQVKRFRDPKTYDIEYELILVSSKQENSLKK